MVGPSTKTIIKLDELKWHWPKCIKCPRDIEEGHSDISNVCVRVQVTS